MTDEIYQLTFVATRRFSHALPDGIDRLNRLYEDARGFEQLGLTGMVLHHGERLLYCIEGEESIVAVEYEKIKRDPGVQGVAILRQCEVERRAFGRWGFAVDDDPRDDQPALLADRVVVLVASAPAQIRHTFLAFARLHPTRRAS